MTKWVNIIRTVKKDYGLKSKKFYFIILIHSFNCLIFSYLSTIEAFKERAQCMIDQYSSYAVKEINMTVLNLTFGVLINEIS